MGRSLFGAVRYRLNARNLFGLQVRIMDSERGVSGSLAYPSPSARRNETRRMISFHLENQLSGKIRVRHLLYNQNYLNRYREPEGWVPADDRHRTRSTGYQLQVQIQTHPSLNWTGGADIRFDDLESTLFSKKQRNQIGLFVQTEWALRTVLMGVPLGMKLVPAARYDAFENFGDQVSPKTGALIGFGSDQTLTLRGNWGRSFRAPSFNDLYWPADLFSKGNPDLKSETGESWDVGLIFRKSGRMNFRVETDCFRNRIENLILWTADAFGMWSPQNVGRARIEGIENSVALSVMNDRLSLTGTHTWMNARDESGPAGRRLIYRPENKVDAHVGTEWFGFYLGIAYQWVGTRYADEQNAVKLDPYSLMHGKWMWNTGIGRYRVEIALQILNLTDRSVTIVDGYPSPGREFRASIGLTY